MKRTTIFCLLFSLLILAPPAGAGTKEEIVRLQSDVHALQNQMREFEKTFTERIDGLRSLVVQLNDQVAKSNLFLDRVSRTLESQASGSQSVDQTLLQEIRTLSGKIDDSATRISALAQQVADLKVQAKPLSQVGGGSLSEDSVYNQALTDYMQGNFDLAIRGFTAYLSSYPEGGNAAAAQLYVGDALVSQGKLQDGIAAFTRVITDYPGADQVPSAIYKRGLAELDMHERDNAIADFKDVIQKFPEKAEAELARSKLRELGVRPAGATRRKSR